MIFRTTTLLFFFLAATAHLGFAQKYNIKTYSVNDGLPSSSVYDVYPDELGYLWFATAYGVIRYDGEEYLSFGVDDGLRDEIIYDFYFEKNNLAWVSTDLGGVARFDGNTFEYLNELAVLDTMVVNLITETREDELWFSTNRHGIIIWEKRTSTFKRIDTNSGLPDNQVWDVKRLSDGNFWIATMYGVAVTTIEGDIQKIYTSEEQLFGEAVYELTETSDGVIWMASSKGVIKVYPDDQIEHITTINEVEVDYVFTIQADNNDRVYIGTERQGVFIYENNQFLSIKRKNGLSSNFIYRIINDDEGTIWIATDGNGVNLFKDTNFKRYDIESELGASYIYSLYLAKDETLWIGTEKGLARYKDGVFKHFVPPSDLFKDDEIWDIEEMPNGHLQLLTYTYEILEFDGERFTKSSLFDIISEAVYVNDILVDNEGTIWVSSYGELREIRDNQLINIYKTDTDFGYWKQSFLALYKDSDGLLWIGTEDGLALFKDGEFRFFDRGDGLIGQTVYELTEDQHHNLWLSTNAGVATISRESIRDRTFLVNTGFTEYLDQKESIFLLFDRANNLWQGTNAGINYFDISKLDENGRPVQRHYTLQDSKLGLEFNGLARVMDKNGDLWFGTAKGGLVHFSVDSDSTSLKQSEAPNVYLRTIQSGPTLIYDQINAEGAKPDTSLSYEFNDLSFHFNVIDYKYPDDTFIRYKLEGLDTNWKETENFNELRYTNLPAGSYTLLISAKSRGSQWSEISELAKITIQKPFYLTYWFIALSITIAVGLIFLIVNVLVNRFEKKELQHLVDLQTEELSTSLREKEVLIKEIHHRVKNNLAVVSGLLELQGFKMPAGEARLALQESKLRVIAMSKIHENLYQNNDLANVDFRKFIQELVKSVQLTMNITGKDISIIQHVEPILLDVNVGIPLGLIANELLSNCYKHAFNDMNEGTITISFNQTKKEYELRIKDNGVGSEEDILSFQRKTLGLTLVKSLAAQINATIEYSGLDGSEFVLKTPKKPFN